MSAPDALSHCVTVEVRVPAERAYGFLMDGLALGRWALGAWATKAMGDGLFVGRSLFDGSEAWLRLTGDPERLTVDYHLGSGRTALVPRIMARVVPGPVTGRPEGHCLVSLIAWRDAAMDDARWHRLVACHEAEILLIKALIEQG
jgi:hypothetical protein